MLRTVLLITASAAGADFQEAPGHSAGGPGPLLVERGEELGFEIPMAEQLEFDVNVFVPILGETGLGSFELSAGTEPYRAGLQTPSSTQKVGWVRGTASGAVLNYRLKHQIDVRIVPQAWPHVIYRDEQSGSENRRKEMRYGSLNGESKVLYRADRHCSGCDLPEHVVEGTWPFSDTHHCKGCKRARHRDWSPAVIADAPPYSLDMLSAIYLARSMVSHGRQRVAFPMLDKDKAWRVTLTSTVEKTIRVPAGSFRCRAVKLSPELSGEKQEKFRGLFGIHGSLSIWLDAASGVPVKIEGKIPAGPMNVDIALTLARHEGTPATFGSIE